LHAVEVGVDAGDHSSSAGKPHWTTLRSNSSRARARRNIAAIIQAIDPETKSAVTSATMPGKLRAVPKRLPA